MKKNSVLFVVLLLLGYGFWLSQDFKNIAAGVAIFLFGMLFLENGFTAFTGGTLEVLLNRSTNKLWKSLLFGIGTTSVMQSSSLVSVITISFLSAGLISLAAGVGIIFGANIGTTTGAWLMAGFGMKVNISAYAMPMLVFGLILVFQKKKALKGIGNILAGMGFLFLGIHYMKEGFEAVKETIDLASYAMPGLMGILVFTGIGVFATVVMQSSHATLMLIIAGLAVGQITYENALALAIGANIGTTITAILGAISANIAGKRLAGAHLIFNTITAVIAIVFIHQFKWAVNETAAFIGLAEDDWTMKLAVFHTLFNFVGVGVMLPFISLLVRFLEKRVVVTKERDVVSNPIYLNDAALQLPDTALQVLMKEAAHLFDNAFEIIAHGMNLHRIDILSGKDVKEVVRQSRTVMEIDVMEQYYHSIKIIYNAIISFATKTNAQQHMTEEQLNRVHDIRIVCRNIAEMIKKISLMRANISKYMVSPNEAIRDQYNLIRSNLAGILRRIYRIRDATDDVVIFLSIQELKEDVKNQDILANGTLDHLVREEMITSEMATSLLNDNALANEISILLIENTERMFVVEGSDLKTLEKDLLSEETDFLQPA